MDQTKENQVRLALDIVLQHVYAVNLSISEANLMGFADVNDRLGITNRAKEIVVRQLLGLDLPKPYEKPENKQVEEKQPEGEIIEPVSKVGTNNPNAPENKRNSVRPDVSQLPRKSVE